ncbi:MAG: DMT family transporter [Pseudomonadota bacterium]
MTASRTSLDWILFSALSLLWASAYAFTRMAVSKDAPEFGFSAFIIIPARVTIGAIILLTVAHFSSQKWPPLSDWRKYATMAALGIIGTALPFFVITSAQETVDSSLAALYVAAAPLFVAVMAHFVFNDDRITPRKGLGLVVGFAGVALLFGRDAITAFGTASVTAQILLLLGTSFYAIATISARYGKDIPPLIFAAGFVTIAALVSWPMLFFADLSALTPSTEAIVGIMGLGLGPTAAASILYMILIARTSATFLSLTGYTIPVISVVIGYLAFGEVRHWSAFAAFGLILLGVWLAQRGGQAEPTSTGETCLQSQ